MINRQVLQKNDSPQSHPNCKMKDLDRKAASHTEPSEVNSSLCLICASKEPSIAQLYAASQNNSITSIYELRANTLLHNIKSEEWDHICASPTSTTYMHHIFNDIFLNKSELENSTAFFKLTAFLITPNRSKKNLELTACHQETLAIKTYNGD